MAERSNEPTEMLRLRKFAARMDISEWAARAWVRDGRVSSVKLGKLIYVPAGEIDRLLTENMRPRLDHCRRSVVEAA